MNAHLEDDEWMMGGSKDAKANAAVGVTEPEVAQMAVEAYAYAWDKCRTDQMGEGGKERWIFELVSELEYYLRERLDLLKDE